MDNDNVFPSTCLNEDIRPSVNQSITILPAQFIVWKDVQRFNNGHSWVFNTQSNNQINNQVNNFIIKLLII